MNRLTNYVYSYDQTELDIDDTPLDGEEDGAPTTAVAALSPESYARAVRGEADPDPVSGNATISTTPIC